MAASDVVSRYLCVVLRYLISVIEVGAFLRRQVSKSGRYLGSVVRIASWVISELHMLRSIARRCELVRLSLRPP